MHRLTVSKDDRSFDERTEKLFRDVRKQLDEDLTNFGFSSKGKKILSLADDDTDDDDDLGVGKLLSSRTRSLLEPRGKTSLSSLLGSGHSSLADKLLRNKPSNTKTTTTFLTSDSSVGDLSSSQPDPAGRPFCVSFDLKGFNAEDISVTCEDGVMSVSARQENTVGGATSVKEFSRKVKIPKNVEPEQLISTFTNDGILTVEAPPDCKLLLETQNNEADVQAAPVEKKTSRTEEGVPVGFQCSSDTSASGSMPLDTPVFSSDASGKRKMMLLLEVGPQYEPNDVVVRLEGKKLIVEATHEEKASGKSSKISMQRDFDLAEDIDVSSVEALLKGQKLTITALVEKQGRCKIIAS